MKRSLSDGSLNVVDMKKKKDLDSRFQMKSPKIQELPLDDPAVHSIRIGQEYIDPWDAK